MCNGATKTKLLEILSFKHFYRHLEFVNNPDGSRQKVMREHINVSIAIEVVCGDTLEE